MTNSTASGRCKAIAVSTGQQCTRSGKLDGYCSEKHKEQAGALYGGRKPGASPFTDSEAEKEDEDDKPQKATKTTKALKALGIKKSAAVDDNDDTVRPAPVPIVEPEPKAAVKKTAAAKATKKTSAPRKAAAASRKKKVIESSDEFEPESESDYVPVESEISDTDDFDVSDDDDSDDVDELSGKMASIKIQPNKPAAPARTEEDGPLETMINRTKSKIFSTNAVLAPPKNKTKSSSASGRPTGGFWVPAPAPVKLPESTLKILSVVKEKLLDRRDSDDAVTPITNPHDAPDKKPSGFFKYKVKVHEYLHSHEDKEDTDSKRAAVRRMFHNIGSLFKPKTTDTPAPEKEEKKKPVGGMVTTTKPEKRRESQDSVDSITKNINDLSVKADDDSDDEFPNQCHGFNTNGHRCKRKVKLDRPQEKGEVLMCHDHEVNDEDEVVVHIEGKGGVLLQWLDVSGKTSTSIFFGVICILHQELPTRRFIFFRFTCGFRMGQP